jgi:hypothetical protein
MTTIGNASTEGNHTEIQENGDLRKQQQTLMGGEKPVSMEIETEQPTQRVDNDYQEQENQGNRHVTEKDDNETRNMQLITQSAPNTDQETTTSREEGPVQQEAQVRSGTTPTTTSDDD